MPRINFSTVDDATDFTPLPEGTYACRIDSVEEARTSRGDEMWKLRLVVTEGEYAGRLIFDNLVFSEKALKRVKFVCSRLGLDVSGELDLTPAMIHGKTCRVRVEIEEYVDEEEKEKTRNRVPFAGYVAAASDVDGAAGSEEGATDGDGDDDLPF